MTATRLHRLRTKLTEQIDPQIRDTPPQPAISLAITTSDETAQGQLRPVVRDRLAHLEHGQPGARKGLRQMNPAAALPATAGDIGEQTA